jgi:hypothetical protein
MTFTHGAGVSSPRGLGGYSPVLAVGVGSKGGLATEAARAVLDDALASGIGRVWATIRPHNTASLRVAAKIGMTPGTPGRTAAGHWSTSPARDKPATARGDRAGSSRWASA